jgi:hypothetical protein
MSEATARPPVPARSIVPARYIEALRGADPFETQRKAPKRLKKILKGMSEKQLARRPAPDKWSIKEVVAHLADGEVIMGSRIRFVAAQDRPPLPGYDQDLFVQNLGIEKIKTKDLLEAFAMARKLNMQLLARLPESALDRVGLHGERGEESIRTMITMYAGHDLIHEDQVRIACDALRTAKKQKASVAEMTRPEADSSEKPRKADRPAKAEKRARKKADQKADTKKSLQAI